MPRRRTPEQRAADLATNHHEGHSLSWVEVGTTSYGIRAVYPDGRIIIEDTPTELDTTEAWLWCDDCQERCDDSVGITGNSVTILTYWEDEHE